MDQKEHRQIFPRPGWVEHDAEEIWTNVQAVVKGALAKLKITAKDLAAVGITNQRETTVVWDKATGKPVHNAIVWQDTRTDRLVRDLGGSAGRTASATSAACRWPPISPGPRSAGCSTTSMACAPAPRPARCCSAPWTAG